ncbi:hypothetical protein L7F22_041320 [Adiantum nelumboides]|nr:hypothetical protein [Adiantum nelumboides]
MEAATAGASSHGAGSLEGGSSLGCCGHAIWYSVKPNAKCEGRRGDASADEQVGHGVGLSIALASSSPRICSDKGTFLRLLAGRHPRSCLELTLAKRKRVQKGRLSLSDDLLCREGSKGVAGE